MIEQSPYIVCPKCGMVSHNPNDVRERYCGACHVFHDDLVLRVMSDAELVGPRTITSCRDVGDESWECVLSCGHETVLVIQPATMELVGCAQCIHTLLERWKKR